MTTYLPIPADNTLIKGVQVDDDGVTARVTIHVNHVAFIASTEVQRGHDAVQYRVGYDINPQQPVTLVMKAVK